MARIRPARGQERSGDGATPAPGGARTPAKRRSAGGPPNPRPTPQGGGGRRKPDKAGTVTKAVVQQRRGSRFLNEVVAELRKVSWPTRSVLMQSTAVVIVVVAIVSIYLAVLDAVFRRLVDTLF
jgi:preprotein translocase subunit SecE